LPSSEYSTKFVHCDRTSGFHFFRFGNSIFFYNAGSSALRRTPNLEDQVSVFMPRSGRAAQ
jgi:hypothetical protein